MGLCVQLLLGKHTIRGRITNEEIKIDLTGRKKKHHDSIGGQLVTTDHERSVKHQSRATVERSLEPDKSLQRAR